MAIAVTTELAPNCDSGSLPVASLELFESPDSPRDFGPQLLDVGTTIQVLDGVVYVTAADNDWVLTPGDTATIPAGVSYRRWNAGDDAARWVEAYCAGA
jgi:Cupin domain